MVRNWSKSICQVEESDMKSPSFDTGIFDDFFKRLVVLNTPIDSREKGLLDGRVNEFISSDECGDTIGEDKVERFSYATCERYHSKVCGVFSRIFLMNQLNDRLRP